MDLKGKSYLLIGAAGRIGSCLTQSLLEKGANVIAVDQNLSALQAKFESSSDKARLSLMEGDITSVNSLQKILGSADDRFGGLQGAVNTAYPRNKNYGRHFFDVTYEDFSENISLHLGGYFLFMQQCFKYAKERKCRFSLVQFSSVYGLMAPRFEVYDHTAMTMPVEYAAIKAGIQHLMRYATAYAKGTEFRVNCVSPGGILAGQPEEFLERYKGFCRGKGMLNETDIIGAVQFLLSDASLYICGQNLIVDDGFST